MFFFSGIDANESQIITSQAPEKGNLYLGNIKTAKDKNFFKEKKIKYCLSVIQKKLSIFDFMEEEKIIQKTISAYDIPSFQIYPYLDEAADFIKDSLEKSNILVHCGSGISRSTTCVIAYFIKYQKMSMEEAWSLIKKERSFVHPNKGFQKQLKKFEDFLRNGEEKKNFDDGELEDLKKGNLEFEDCGEEGILKDGKGDLFKGNKDLE